MPNDYFQFKQFTIHQANNAMKVCTDSCIFGAWLATHFKNKQIKTILDIGTGTGLLSLQFAQKNSAQIDAIEIDSKSAEEAKKNVAASPFYQQIQVIQADIKDFISYKKYSLIFTNPPFYEKDLPSNNPHKLRAHHHTHLTISSLFQSVRNLATENACFALLIPFKRTEEILQIATLYNWQTQEVVTVKNFAHQLPIRTMLLLRKEKADETQSELIIYNSPKVYSSAFIALLKDYYLFL
ncbi:MAG: tRNA1(Val) (adenine(37)-N6)-methyltransferase [Chitinophagaceae bacterium]